MAGETRFTVPDDRPVVVVERTFAAPRHAVFEAMTTPGSVERWYGPCRYSVEVPELDLRPGGNWRFLNVDADGTTYGFHGKYIEIVPDERIVQTWVYDGAPDVEVLETAQLEEHDGATTLTATAEYPTFESRAADLQHDMLAGASETYDRLAEVTAEIAAR